MLKFLTIVFFIFYLFIAIFHYGLLRNSTNNVYIKLKESIQINNSTDLEIGKSINPSDALTMVFVILFILVIYIIEIPYLICSIKHDPNQYIVIGYFIFWITMLLKGTRKAKSTGNLKINEMTVSEATKYLDEQIKTMNEINLREKFQSIIDISFYTYMIYIFFIR